MYAYIVNLNATYSWPRQGKLWSNHSLCQVCVILIIIKKLNQTKPNEVNSKLKPLWICCITLRVCDYATKENGFARMLNFFIGSYNISDEIKTYENNCVKLCKYESKAHV